MICAVHEKGCFLNTIKQVNTKETGYCAKNFNEQKQEKTLMNKSKKNKIKRIQKEEKICLSPAD